MSEFVKNIFRVMKNQLVEIFKDPGAILVVIVGVILYALIYAIPYSTELIKNVPIGVVDFDDSTQSRQIVRNIDASDFVDVSENLASVQEMQDKFFKNEIKSYVVIPKNFERDLKRGKKVTLALYSDSAYLLIYKAVANGLIPTVTEFSTRVEIHKLMLKGASKQEAMNQVQPFRLVNFPLFNPSGGYESYLYPIILILILQQTLFVGIGLLDGSAKEKMSKSINFCAVSNKPLEIVLGKSLAFLFIYLVHSFIYFFIFPSFHHYSVVYHPMSLFVILIPYLLSVCFLSQTFVYFFNEREGSLLTITITSLPVIFLAGFLWPKESFPAWINFLATLLPSTSAINGIIRINQMDASFLQILPDFLTLIGLCILYFILALLVVKKVVAKDIIT